MKVQVGEKEVSHSQIKFIYHATGRGRAGSGVQWQKRKINKLRWPRPLNRGDR